MSGMRKKRNIYTVLVRKPEGKWPLGNPRHRWKYNINIYLKNRIGGYGLDLTWLRTGTNWQVFVNTNEIWDP